MVAASSSSRALCSRAWWPQKRSSPPLGRTARTDAAAPHRSHLSAAVSAAGLARIPVMSSSHLRPPRTAAYVYLYSDATGAGSVPSEANALQHIYLPAIKCPTPATQWTGSHRTRALNVCGVIRVLVHGATHRAENLSNTRVANATRFGGHGRAVPNRLSRPWHLPSELQ